MMLTRNLDQQVNLTWQNNIKKIDDDAISENCDIIAIFSIYGQFGVTRKPDSRPTVCKTYIFINSNLLS